MLVIITGDRQVGKTRWLEQFISNAVQSGFRCVGLISPGIWVKHDDGNFEKTGINALLLPENEEFPYAIRRDLTDEETEGFSQADKAQLVWRVYDQAIERINDHFDKLHEEGLAQNDILIIDEIGSLELVFGEGFTSALRMLDDPTFAANVKEGISAERNAVMIMRPELLEQTKERLTPIWGEPLIIDISDNSNYLGIESLIRSFSSASDRS